MLIDLQTPEICQPLANPSRYKGAVVNGSAAVR
jgi:hypothetical protein